MMRITMNPAYFTEQLIERKWEPQHIQLMYDRIWACVEAGEDFVDVCRRLNPTKVTRPAWEPSVAQARARAFRESPPLDPDLSVRVRDARTRLNI